MYHQQLEKQIRKHLGDSFAPDEKMAALLKSISNTYDLNERDKELTDHATALNELEYQEINQRLQKLTEDQEEKIRVRTAELESIAEFPLVNPNPIFRVGSDGIVTFSNPAAEKIKSVQWNGRNYTTRDFFQNLIPALDEKEGTISVFSGKKEFLFYYKQIEGKDYINLYAADVTEKNTLRRLSQENYQRLRNFLESTDDIYYIIYEKNPEKNLITSKWKDLFGFTASKVKNILKERSKTVISEKPAEHMSRILQMPQDSKKTLRYQVKNKETGTTYWISENISKYYDDVLNDTVVSGRITDITRELMLSMQIRESEQRFRTLIDAIPVMVWVSNENNIVTYSNRALKDFLGFDLEKMKNYRHFTSFIHPDDRNIAVDQWQKEVKKKKTIQSQYRMKDAQGNMHHISEKAVPRFYADGKFAGYIGSFFDMTNEKLFQETLTIEKEKLELLTQNSPDIIILADAHGQIEYASPSVKTMLGYEPEKMLKKSIQKFVCEECVEFLSKHNWLNTSGRRGYKKFEYRMMASDKRLFWVESVISVISNNKTGEKKILMYNRNIHEVKEAQMAMQESERKYRSLFENMNLGVMEVDTKDNIQWVNQSFENLSGYSLKYLKGKNAKKQFLLNNYAYKILDQVMQQRMGKQESIYEIKMKKNDGTLLDVVISGSPIVDIHGNVKGSVGIHWDVTEVRKLERQVEEEKASRQREIMQATINAEEQQRLILGNDLHDGVGHVLTYTSLFLQMASGDTVSDSLIIKAKQKVDEALAEVKRISKNLTPPALTDLGLKEAITELFNQYHTIQNTQFLLECKPADFKGISIEVLRTIYRIIQELISNTVKHSSATKVSLVFKRTQKELIMKYQDNGIGFEINKVKKGVGLQSVNNRVYFYNGQSTIDTAQGKGCKYTIQWSLENISDRLSLTTKNK